MDSCWSCPIEYDHRSAESLRPDLPFDRRAPAAGHRQLSGPRSRTTDATFGASFTSDPIASLVVLPLSSALPGEEKRVSAQRHQIEMSPPPVKSGLIIQDCRRYPGSRSAQRHQCPCCAERCPASRGSQMKLLPLNHIVEEAEIKPRRFDRLHPARCRLPSTPAELLPSPRHQADACRPARVHAARHCVCGPGLACLLTPSTNVSSSPVRPTQPAHRACSQVCQVFGWFRCSGPANAGLMPPEYRSRSLARNCSRLCLALHRVAAKDQSGTEPLCLRACCIRARSYRQFPLLYPSSACRLKPVPCWHPRRPHTGTLLEARSPPRPPRPRAEPDGQPVIKPLPRRWALASSPDGRSARYAGESLCHVPPLQRSRGYSRRVDQSGVQCCGGFHLAIQPRILQLE